LTRTLLERLSSATDKFRDLLLRQEWFNCVLMPAIPRNVRWKLCQLYFMLPDLIEAALGNLRDDGAGTLGDQDLILATKVGGRVAP